MMTVEHAEETCQAAMFGEPPEAVASSRRTGLKRVAWAELSTKRGVERLARDAQGAWSA